MRREVIVDLLFDALVVLLILHFGRKVDCGIPIIKWCLYYFCFLAMRSLANYAKVALVRYYLPQHLNAYTLVSFVVIDGGFLLWLIYGNVLFYSSENQCKDSADSLVIYNLMLVLLIVGYC